MDKRLSDDISGNLYRVFHLEFLLRSAYKEQNPSIG
jgi:hypothetical protein